MKVKRIITVGLLFLSLVSFSQVLENVDYISPEKDGIIAIKKGDRWGFIDSNAKTLIEFRNDLIALATKDGNYPGFFDNRCLMRRKIDGVYHYGYIDISGSIAIEPQFLYATSFKGGKAIILKKVKEKVGENTVLGKNVVSTRLEEYVIDTSGRIIKFLSSRHYVPKKSAAKSELKINSKFITTNLIAVKSRTNKWTLYKI